MLQNNILGFVLLRGFLNKDLVKFLIMLNDLLL